MNRPADQADIEVFDPGGFELVYDLFAVVKSTEDMDLRFVFRRLVKHFTGERPFDRKTDPDFGRFQRIDKRGIPFHPFGHRLDFASGNAQIAVISGKLGCGARHL